MSERLQQYEYNRRRITLNVYQINMDIKQRKEILHTNIYITQNDSQSVTFQFHLTDGIKKVKPVGHHAVIFFKRPDHTFVQGNLEITRDAYEYTLQGTELSVPGHVSAYIKIYSQDGTERLTLQPFLFEALGDLDSAVFSSVQSTPQYEALTEAFSLLNQAKQLNNLLNGVCYSVEEINANVDISDVTCFLKCNTVSITGEVLVKRLERPIRLLKLPGAVLPKKPVKTFAMVHTRASQPKLSYVTVGTDGIITLDTYVNTLYSGIILDIRYEL